MTPWELATATSLMKCRTISITVLTLALGLGATTAIFSAVYPILFQSLPYPQAGRQTRPKTTLQCSEAKLAKSGIERP